MSTVELHTLEVGKFFLIDWFPEGNNVGEVLYQGVGSVYVRVPKREGGVEDTHWSQGTCVTPVDKQEVRHYLQAKATRARSDAESPVELVHRICNEMKGATRDAIISACLEQGVNVNTAKTQYYAWRRKQR